LQERFHSERFKLFKDIEMMRVLRALFVLTLFMPIFLGEVHAEKKKKIKVVKPLILEEIGVLKNKEIKVVQKILFEKKERHEFSIFTLFQTNDPYVTTILPGLAYSYHFREDLALEVIPLSYGFGIKSSIWKELTRDPYNLGEGYYPDANRILISLQANALWSPIYAKLNLLFWKVIHFDVYLIGGIGYCATRRLIDE
jgi:hypothetical protein